LDAIRVDGVSTVFAAFANFAVKTFEKVTSIQPDKLLPTLLDLEPDRVLFRGVMVLAGLSFIGFGFAALRSGSFQYLNWFNQPIFAPFAIIFGLVFVFGGLFKPKIFR
jgi:hypothetical protein